MTATIEQVGMRLADQARQREIQLRDDLISHIEAGDEGFEDSYVEELLRISGKPIDYVGWLHNRLRYRKQRDADLERADEMKGEVVANEQEVARLNEQAVALRKKFEEEWCAIGRQVQSLQDDNSRLRREANDLRNGAIQSLRSTCADPEDGTAYLDWRNAGLERPVPGPDAIKGLPII